jgi:hypothetical protein
MSTLTPRQEAENTAFPFADYLADPSRRLVFAAIPKSGCSDLKHWFISLVEPERLADPAFRLHAYCSQTHTLARFTQEERERLLRESFTMAFVREPVSRVVSAYVEKFVRPAPAGLFEPAREVVSVLGADPARGVTFREFVRFLEKAPDEHLDSHWRPQAAFLRGVRIDLLGRMEALPSMLESLGKELGMPPRVAGRRNATGYTPPSGENVADTPSAQLHESGALPPAADLIDGALRETIERRYREDAMLYEGATDAPPESALLRLRRVLGSDAVETLRGGDSPAR